MRAKLRATFLRSQRERSRDKTKKEDDEKTYKKDEGSDEEDEMVLSDCEECQEIIKRLALAGKSHDKLNKYLQKYA